MSKINETSKSYIAGIVDGEGCIGIWKREPTSKSYALKLKVKMNDYHSIKYIQKNFGGNIYISSGFLRNGKKYNGFYSIEYASTKAAHILKLILPYLKVKKQQAQVAIKFNKLKQKHPTSKVLAQCHQLHKKCKKLKTQFWIKK